MAEAIVSKVLEQLTATIAQEAMQMVDVKKDLQKLQRMFETIKKVLADAENKQFKDESIEGWLRELKEVAYDMEDVLDEWNTSIQKQQLEGVYDNSSIMWEKVCLFFTSFCDCFRELALRHDIASKIKKINEDLDEIIKVKNSLILTEIRTKDADLWQERSTTDYINESEVRGRDEDKNILVNKLLSESSKGGKDLQVISLVGMGGIGKTTLAQSVYNHVDIVKSFYKRAWVCVSEPFDKFRVAKAIIREMGGQTSNLNELQSHMKEIHDCITGKKFLLVLDDVWTKDHSDLDFSSCLTQGATGSKILVTTRKKEVADALESDIIFVKELSDFASWSLFSQLAFSESSKGDEELENIGRKIVAKCKGLPLAVKALGSLLRFKSTTEEWQRISENAMWELDEFEEGPLPPLLLSYSDLPNMVKHCFSYCAVFPKDYTIAKDDLIKLWMAHGYLDSKNRQTPEVIGNEYFNILANRSFFQEFKKEDDETTCKMHDITHDLAQYLTRNECIAIGVNDHEDQRVLSSCENARHMTVLEDSEISLADFCARHKKLRSLLSFRLKRSAITLLVTSLRVLKLPEWESFLEILKEIEKLILLRYLNVSRNTALKELPSALCELYNLQTLNIRYCWRLTALPRGIGKLINLRHLMNIGCDELSYMPKGIERLTNLRTLDEFVVSDGNHASTLASLKSLKHLQGRLWIRRLGNVRNVSEAKEAQLRNKTKLTGLALTFDKSKEEGEEGARTAEDDELLLKALLPPPTNLRRLEIRDYRGNVMSHQICLTSLTKLTELSIKYCGNTKFLPPLGRLPSLESLCIWSMGSVKNVGRDWLGIESGMPTSSSSASSSSITAFPKLTSLEFSFMDEWEEWDYEITGKQEDIHIMPSLRTLEIENCPKLKALPDHLWQNTSLKELKIDGCGNMEFPSPLGRLPSLESLALEGMERVKKVGREWLGIESGMPTSSSSSAASSSSITAFPKLTSLEFSWMSELEEWDYGITGKQEDIHIMPSLRSLKIHCCRKLRALPDHLLQNTSLRELHLESCWNMEFLPLGRLPFLESLFLEGMERVKNMGREWLGIESGMPTSSSAAASSSSITAFPKLTSLTIYSMHEWEEWDYGITGKQEDIHIMPSLCTFEISFCQKLKALPDHLLQNTSLKELKIEECRLLYSYLKKRLQDWPLNVHIPQIYYHRITSEEDSRLTNEEASCHNYKSAIDPKEHKFDLLPEYSTEEEYSMEEEEEGGGVV